MKKFFIKAVLLSLPVIISMIIVFIMDPYNVFHYKNIRDNGVEPNKNYIKMRYILDNPGKFDSFLFGSSRVGGINVTDIPGLRCYNMTYSEGLPREHFENLEVLIQKGIIPNTVMVGVDDIACYVIPETHRNSFLRMPYPQKDAGENWPYFTFLIKYLHPVLLGSIPTILFNKGNSTLFREQFYGNGGRQKSFDEQYAQETDWEHISVYSLPFKYGIDNAIADIQSIIRLCGENDIRLILFTNPLHHLTYRLAVEHGYIDFLSRLSDITDFYNFSGINDITINNDNYLETKHYQVKVGDLIIGAIFNEKIDQKLLTQGFGYHVTDKNKNDFFDILHH
jgi:hypothetical protein